MIKTILTSAELDILTKLEARGVSLDMEKIETECEIVEKKERESHIDFCKDSDIKESFKSARESVKSLKGFKYDKSTLTTKQAEKLGSNYKKVSKVRVSVDSYDINIKASYKFLDSNGNEVKPAKKESN
jgi:ATP phosphoribosyltransferase regulatory subunit HisZ